MSDQPRFREAEGHLHFGIEYERVLNDVRNTGSASTSRNTNPPASNVTLENINVNRKKILIAGLGEVGKTTLFHELKRTRSTDRQIPSSGLENIKYEFWDIPDSYDNNIRSPLLDQMSDFDAIIYVIDISIKASENEHRIFRKHLKPLEHILQKKEFGLNKPILIFANKVENMAPGINIQAADNYIKGHIKKALEIPVDREENESGNMYKLIWSTIAERVGVREGRDWLADKI